MAKVEAQELEQAILGILGRAATGKGTAPGFLTAYQILNRLDAALQDRLRAEYGDESGRHAGHHFSSATRVAQVAADLRGVQKEYLDTSGLQFDVSQSPDVEAGYNLCAIFRRGGP